MVNVQHGQPTALVVEDDPPLLQFLVEILQDEGFNATGVDRGQLAIDTLRQQCFDLLLLDIGLPDVSGLEICELARAQYDNAITILVITANATQQRCVTALEVGADDFLAKPFDVDEFLTRIMVKIDKMATIDPCSGRSASAA